MVFGKCWQVINNNIYCVVTLIESPRRKLRATFISSKASNMCMFAIFPHGTTKGSIVCLLTSSTPCSGLLHGCTIRLSYEQQHSVPAHGSMQWPSGYDPAEEIESHPSCSPSSHHIHSAQGCQEQWETL